ncbi:MAG: HWE histidine kinase domain-containing protein [Rhodospirillales bacterium]
MRSLLRRTRPLILLFWASLVIPAAVAAGVAALSNRSLFEIAELRVEQSAAVLREQALRVFEAQELAMRWIDQRVRGMNWDEIETSDAVRDLLAEIIRASPHIDAIWLVRPDGRPAVGTDLLSVAPDGIAGRDDFRTLQQRDTLVIGGDVEARAAGSLTANLSRRRTGPGGAFDGIIVINGALTYFETVWESAALAPNKTVAVVGVDGAFLARYPSRPGAPTALPPTSPFFAAVAQSEIGVHEAVSAEDGVSRIYGHAKLGDLPAYLLVGQDRTLIEAQSRASTLRIAAVALAVTLVLLSAVLIAMRHDRSLRRETRRRFEAEASLIGKSEHLAALQRVEAALRRSEERFRTLFATLTQGVVYHDADGRVVSANRAAEDILGTTAEEMMNGRPDWRAVDATEAPLPDDQHPALVALRTARTVRGVLIGVHNPVRGERRWLTVDAIPQFRPGATAPDGVCTLFSDSTDRRRTEAAQGLLVREVDHRAKNAVALVLAVIKLTKARTIPEFVRKIEGRIGALSRAHTLLSVSKWEGAELGVLVQQELDAFMDEGWRVTMEGPDLMLDAVAAQPVGMLLHELATNAAKHGALAVPEGRLTITWRRDPTDRGLELVWDEDGGPPVPADRPQGFGSLLIRSTVEAQLGGTVDLDWRPSGLRATLRLGETVLAPSRPAAAPARRGGPAGDGAGVVQAKVLRVLVVDDDPVAGPGLVAARAALGHPTLGPMRSLEAARTMAQGQTFDLAVVAQSVRGASTRPFVDLLRARGVPFGYRIGTRATLDGWPDAPAVRTPLVAEEVAALVTLIADRALVGPAA